MKHIPTKYRIAKWINITEKSIFYGVDAKIEGDWCHCMEDGKMISFTEKKDAQKEVRRLNKTLNTANNDNTGE